MHKSLIIQRWRFKFLQMNRVEFVYLPRTLRKKHVPKNKPIKTIRLAGFFSK